MPSTVKKKPTEKVASSVVIEAVEQRLAELKPLVDEYTELQNFKERFMPRTARIARRAPRSSVSQRSSKRSSNPIVRNGPVTRRVRQAIENNPEGAKVKEIAEQAKTSPAYAHDVVGKLVEAGEARRQDELVLPVQK